MKIRKIVRINPLQVVIKVKFTMCSLYQLPNDLVWVINQPGLYRKTNVKSKKKIQGIPN